MQTNQPEPLSILTFNTGLAEGFIPYTAQRVIPIAKTLACSDADIICLQELWYNPDKTGQWSTENIHRLVDVTRHIYPYSYIAPLPESRPKNEHKHSALHFHYAGQPGLAILSRFPLAQTRILFLPSTLIRRAVLYARIAIPHFDDELEIYCTHLSADLSHLMPYPIDLYESFEMEQRAQIHQLFQWVNTSNKKRNIILAGDFNCGPELSGMEGELAHNFHAMEMADFDNAYLKFTNKPQPTYSGENTFVDTGSAKLIDHFWLRLQDDFEIHDVQRVFEHPIDIELDGQLTQISLSDHYGLMLQIAKS